MWNLGKFAFSDELIPLYADHVARTVAALRGKSRKALILDLDNTVWGGVIGDDGLDGIQVAQGDARGEAHLAVQRLALDLRQRGIVLAVSSKNTDEIAREPFLKHPEMLLKLDHIAVVFQLANLERQSHATSGPSPMSFLAWPRRHGITRRQSRRAWAGAQLAAAGCGARVA